MLKLLLAGASLMLVLAGVALWLDRPTSTRLPPPMHILDRVDATPGAIYSAKFSDLDGVERELGEWQHKFLVLNFWATWCAPCKEEMPMLAAFQREFGPKGLQIVGIAADSRSNVANFAKTLPVGYPLLPDEGRAIEFSKRLGNRLGLLPFTIAFKPGGQVVYARLGIITEAEMRDLLVKNI